MEKLIKSIVYGIGGHDETKPNNNILEIINYTDQEAAIIEKEQKAQAEAEAARQALLDKLGITADEAKLLLG